MLSTALRTPEHPLEGARALALARAGRGSYSTPDFSVVRAGWGRGEGREVTSLPSLSTPNPLFKTLLSSTAHPLEHVGMGFRLISHLLHPWLN